jgi:HPt (histidine-containing phosphotransfer) domain-containing protein
MLGPDSNTLYGFRAWGTCPSRDSRVDKCNPRYRRLLRPGEMPYVEETIGKIMSDPQSDDPDRAARLRDLQTRFNATLPERVTSIAALTTALRVGPWPEDTGEDLLTEVHGLAGAAGLFGRPRIGDAAAMLEKTLMRLKRRKAFTAVDIAEVRDAAQRLSAVFADGNS